MDNARIKSLINDEFQVGDILVYKPGQPHNTALSSAVLEVLEPQQGPDVYVKVIRSTSGPEHLQLGRMYNASASKLMYKE